MHWREASYDHSSPDYWVDSDESHREFEERSEAYEYSSNHKVDENGLARGGRFNASSVSGETTLQTNEEYSYLRNATFSDRVVTSPSELANESKNERVTVTNENGSYEDSPYGRLQSGSYETNETLQRDWQEKDFSFSRQDYNWGDYFQMGGDNKSQGSEYSLTTTTGSYDPYGGSESVEKSRDVSEISDDLFRIEGTIGLVNEFRTREVLEVSTAEGRTTGHESTESWSFDWEAGSTHSFIDRDIFEGQTPLPPPITGTTYAPNAPGESAETLDLSVAEKPSPGFLGRMRGWLTAAGNAMTAGGNKIRGTADSMAGGIESFTATGNDGVLGTAAAMTGGIAGHVVRMAGAIAGGAVDVPGTVNGVVDDLGKTKAVYDEYGAATAAARQIGLLQAAEAYYGIDVLTGEAVDAMDKVAEASGRIGSTASLGAGVGAGVTRFAKPRSMTPEPVVAPRNPYGSKGKLDHQTKVNELVKKAEAERLPGEVIYRERKVQGLDSNRRPDVQIIDPSGKTRKIFEAERFPNRRYNRLREVEYDRLGVPFETYPL